MQRIIEKEKIESSYTEHSALSSPTSVTKTEEKIVLPLEQLSDIFHKTVLLRRQIHIALKICDEEPDSFNDFSIIERLCAHILELSHEQVLFKKHFENRHLQHANSLLKFRKLRSMVTFVNFLSKNIC